MPLHTAGPAVGGGEDEAGGVGAEQWHVALAGEAAERGDRVALEHDEAQRAGAPEDGHRELYSIGALPSVLDLTLGKSVFVKCRRSDTWQSFFFSFHGGTRGAMFAECRNFPSVFPIFAEYRSLPSIF